MDQDIAKEIQSQLKKVDGGKTHFFAYHAGGDKGVKLALDLRRLPLSAARKWMKEGLSASLLITGVVRPGKSGVEFATPDKSIPGGAPTVQRALRALSPSDGITLLARATVVIDEGLDLSGGGEPATVTPQGGSEAEQRARRRAATRLAEINQAWIEALEASVSGLVALEAQVGAEDDSRSTAIAVYLRGLVQTRSREIQDALSALVEAAPGGSPEDLEKALNVARRAANAGLDFIEERAEVLELIDENPYGVQVGILSGLVDPLMACLDELDALDAAV